MQEDPAATARWREVIAAVLPFAQRVALGGVRDSPGCGRTLAPVDPPGCVRCGAERRSGRPGCRGSVSNQSRDRMLQRRVRYREREFGRAPPWRTRLAAARRPERELGDDHGELPLE